MAIRLGYLCRLWVSRALCSQLHKRFDAMGVWTASTTQGPRRADKLSVEILTFIENTLNAEPDLRTA